MADEFIKGLGTLTIGTLGWMVIMGWYQTPGFEEAQLLGPRPESVDVYGQIALLTGDALFWFGVFGALAFWVLVPAFSELQDALAQRE